MYSLPLIDAHAHLADSRLAAERQSLPQACRDHGLQAVLVNAALPEEWAEVIRLSCLPGFHGALGLHPFFPERYSTNLLPQLEHTLDTLPPDAHIVAIGEIGLDAWNGRDTIAVQRRMLAEQLLLAQRRHLAVALHNRRTWNEFLALVKELGLTTIRGYCHHCTASPDILSKLLDLGLHISFCGPATNPAARRIHDAIRYAPLDAILTETDCPDLPPSQANSPQSRPWHVRFVLQTIAQLKNIPLDTLAGQIADNYHRLVSHVL